MEAKTPIERKTAHDFDQELLILFDAYVHGAIDRRGFLDKAAKYAVGGVTAAMLLDHFGCDRRPGDQWNAELGLPIATDKQHFAEFDDVAGFTWNFFDVQHIVRSNPVLFAACANDSVHDRDLFLSSRAHRRRGKSRGLYRHDLTMSLGQRTLRGPSKARRVGRTIRMRLVLSIPATARFNLR